MATEPRPGAGVDERRCGLRLANGGERRERVRVVQYRGGSASDEHRTLDPGETASFPAPDGAGQVRITLYTTDAVATTSFHPTDGDAFLDVAGGKITVSRH